MERRAEKRAKGLDDDSDSTNSIITIPDSPIYTQKQYERMEYIKKLQEKQDYMRKSMAEKRKGLNNRG